MVRGGVDLIVIPCNTAHYFYNGLCEQIKVPMINIIEETVLHLKLLGVKRFGLLATEGTVASRAYERICERHGLICTVPTNEEQATISSMIYNDIKQNRNPDLDRFLEISKRLLASGCERLVLGCTELSLLKKQLPDTLPFTDSLEVLAHRTIVACNKTPIGFPKEFDREATK